MSVGDYVRTKYGIAKIIDLKENPYGEKTIYVLNKSIINIYDCDGGELACCNPFIEDMQNKFDTKFGDEKCIIKSSPNIIDILEPMDLLYIDISPDNCGGIVVPRIPETLDELEKYIEKIKSGEYILKYVVTHEQLKNIMYKVGE